MNSRSIRIINQLCSGRIYQISELAGLLDISPRLVRYEIDEANSFLSREGFSRIESNRLGVTLLVSEDEKTKLLQRLSELSVYNYSLTTEERKSIIKILLFSSQGYLTSQYFADTLGVSKSCIDKDLVGMKSELKEEGLELYSKPAVAAILLAMRARYARAV
jgi:transcriptional antiterminator